MGVLYTITHSTLYSLSTTRTLKKHVTKMSEDPTRMGMSFLGLTQGSSVITLTSRRRRPMYAPMRMAQVRAMGLRFIGRISPTCPWWVGC